MSPITTMAAALLALTAGNALAQKTYPERPVRLVTGYLAGGGSDFVTRTTAQKLQELLGGTVIVENRTGGGTNIAAEYVARAAPDGHTLLVGGSANTANMTLYRKPGYDIVKDFAPISRLTSGPNILVVHPSVPAKTIPELIALAKKNPGQLTYASAGNASSNHFSGALFTSMAKIDIVHVPYKGGAGAIIDTIAGHVSMYFSTLQTALPHVRSGRVRGLAVTTLKRSQAAPEFPTFAESGLPGFDVAAWHMLLAPAGTPPEIVTKLNAEVVRGLAQPDARQRFATQGFDVVTTTPQALADYIKLDVARSAKIIQASGMKVD
ncbi:MAG TPA: tripartite tricarboxylate transporter substrate binding protein [Burkholderiales bacterium]|nr:tripartite tricarboxylate transporter substrate binding protein [Burkholderiales bacterium]